MPYIYAEQPCNSVRRYAPSDESWVACLNGDGDAVGLYPDRVDLSAYLSVTRYLVRRGLLSFDTSSLAGQFIRSIKLRIPTRWGYEDDEGFSDIHVTKGVFSDPIVISDYQAQLPYTTKGGTALFEDYSLGGFVFIDFNDTALGWINRAGVTKLCLRMAGDLDILPAPEGIQYYALKVDTADPVSAECPRLEVVVGSPGVTTNPATLIGTTSAKLNGTLINGGGEACDCGFEWGETIAYGNTTPTQSKTTGQSFSQSIIGLSPGALYHFRAKATSSETDVIGYGADRTFTTDALHPVIIPTVTTDPATEVEAVSATLNGTLVNDGGEACDCGFEWGETIAYEHGTTPTDSKVTGQSFSQVIIGLDPNTTYHFRAFATNSAGTGYGADRSFTTIGVVAQPGVSGSAALFLLS